MGASPRPTAPHRCHSSTASAASNVSRYIVSRFLHAAHSRGGVARSGPIFPEVLVDSGAGRGAGSVRRAFANLGVRRDTVDGGKTAFSCYCLFHLNSQTPKAGDFGAGNPLKKWSVARFLEQWQKQATKKLTFSLKCRPALYIYRIL